MISGIAPKDRILLPLDTEERETAHALVRALEGEVGAFKIGKEFFTRQGPEGLRAAVGAAPFFLDLKFHDIPNTVAGAIRAATRLGPLLVNVHASGGRAMMTAAAAAAEEAAAAEAIPRPRVLGVTVLTSLDDADLRAVGQHRPAAEQVERLALLAKDCGLDGVVCSPEEITRLRQLCGPDFLLVVPGIRPTWATKGDQKRVMTPAEACTLGADYLVIGRPITAATDPKEAARRIVREIEEAVS